MVFGASCPVHLPRKPSFRSLRLEQPDNDSCGEGGLELDDASIEIETRPFVWRKVAPRRFAAPP